MISSNLKIVAIVIGVVLLIVGLIFVPLNYVSPHIGLVPKSVQVPHQVNIPNVNILGTMKGADLNGSSYRYFPSVKVNASQTLDVVWYSDIFLAGYIFSQEQFNHFQSVFPEIKQDGNKMTLEQENGITYEATGWASKYGEVSYNVTQSGDYVAVLTNVMSGGHFAGVGYFNESAITYSHQTEYVTEVQNLPQNDNLYLYLGSGFIIAGVAVILVFQRTQKAPFQEIKTNILKLIS